MARDERDRSRKREGAERSQERPKELSQEQRSFVGRSIAKCEARREAPEASLTREAPQGRILKPGIGPSVLEKDLELSGQKLDHERPRDKQAERELRVLKDFRVSVEGREIAPFQQEQWARLSEFQRAEAFQKLERLLAKEQGRPEMSVERVRVADAGKRGWKQDEMARYDDTTKTISLRQDTLERDARTALTAYLHEARHAYQHDVMKHPIGRGAMREDARTVQLWQHGKATYPRWEPTTGEEKAKWMREYRSNALEVDSRRYAEQTVRAFYDERP